MTYEEELEIEPAPLVPHRCIAIRLYFTHVDEPEGPIHPTVVLARRNTCASCAECHSTLMEVRPNASSD